MDREHPQRPCRRCRVVMNHRHRRTIQRRAERMDASCQIDIFGIHEETLVEQPCLAKGIAGHEHKAALQIWHVEIRRVIPMSQEIALPAATPQKRRHKTTQYQVGGRREHPAGVLKPSVGIEYTWRSHSASGSATHRLKQPGYDSRIPPDIGVEQQMMSGPRRQRPAKSHIVGGAIATVGHPEIAHSGTRLDCGTKPVVGRIVDDAHGGHAVGLQRRKHSMQLSHRSAVHNHRSGKPKFVWICHILPMIISIGHR